MTDPAAKHHDKPQAASVQPESRQKHAPRSRLPRWVAKQGHVIRNILTLVLVVIALWLLRHEFQSINAAEVAASFRSLPWWAILAALFFTACNYSVLIGYDWLGARLVKHPLSFRQVTVASLLYYAFSNSLGTLFAGTPVRVRLYSSWGMSSQEIVRMIFFISAAFWMGLFTLGGTLFLLTPFDIPSRFNLPLASSRPLGMGLLAFSAAFFAACLFRQRPMRLLGVNFQPPSISIALAQVLVASADLLFAAAALYVLLPGDINIQFLPFTAIYVLAVFVAMVSHVPGGLGVLELVLVTMLPHSTHGIVAPLLVFRVVYYLLPLFLAVASVAIATFYSNAKKASEIAETTVQWTRIVSPRIITGAVFIAGLLLLISGSLPPAEGRQHILRRAMPLPVVELSHFLGSIVGALLLILARALQRRIDAAWGITIALLAVGAIVSLAKGFDYEEAIILAVLLLAMLPCRRHFYRRGSLLRPSLTVGWISAIAISLGFLIGIVSFAYRHVEYSSDLWWEFAYRGDAPRSMRALLGAAIVLALLGVARLLRSRPTAPAPANESELDEIATMVAASAATSANLALLGDKRFIFSEDRKAAVMFGCEGKSWIAMGDPIGPEPSADDAAWNFREACDTAGVWPVFYQVHESSLGRYVEMGLTMLKLGEEARVPLENFSLEGSSRKDLRRTKKKSTEDGLRFEIIPQPDVPALMPQFKAISDAWLHDKSAAEKGFSLGFFAEHYLSRYDIAVIRQQGKPIAFANLWYGANKHELSVDLMRYVPDAPHGVMEYLFVELMLYGREQGYQWFNLGMAPLSGVEPHRLGPLWNQVSSLLFRHGEHFYNFQGLRNYKEKFDPEWFPKYLASPGGLATAQILADVSVLISGGIARLLHARRG